MLLDWSIMRNVLAIVPSSDHLVLVGASLRLACLYASSLTLVVSRYAPNASAIFCAVGYVTFGMSRAVELPLLDDHVPLSASGRRDTITLTVLPSFCQVTGDHACSTLAAFTSARICASRAAISSASTPPPPG